MSVDRMGQLKDLQLHGMAAAWLELYAESPRQTPQPEVWLDRMIEAEQADRLAKRLSYQIKAAKFPVHRDLTGFDWQESPLSQTYMEQLATDKNFRAFLDSSPDVGGVF